MISIIPVHQRDDLVHQPYNDGAFEDCTGSATNPHLGDRSVRTVKEVEIAPRPNFARVIVVVVASSFGVARSGSGKQWCLVRLCFFSLEVSEYCVVRIHRADDSIIAAASS